MIRHSYRSPGNKKKVRYGPVRYVNLILNEPVSTNTFQIGELCNKCGAIRTGPNINEGCKNCLIPKPPGFSGLNKHDFISRSNKSLDKFDQREIQKENLIEFSKEFKLKPCLKECNVVPAQSKSLDKSNKKITHDKNPLSSYDANYINKTNNNHIFESKRVSSKKIEENLKMENVSNLDDIERNAMSPEKLKQTVRILEGKLNFHKHIRFSSESPKSLNRVDSKKLFKKSADQIVPSRINSDQNIYQNSEAFLNINTNKQIIKNDNNKEEIKRKNETPYVIERKSINAVPRKLRNLNLSENIGIDKNLESFARKSISNFEDKLNFFENKNSLVSDSTKSLNNTDEKTILVDTYEIPKTLLKKNNENFGSAKSLESFNEIYVDNLNEIPRILGNLNNKQNIVSRSNRSLENYDPDKTNIIIESPNEIPKLLNQIKTNKIEISKNLSPNPIKPRRSLLSNSWKCPNCDKYLIPGEHAIIANEIDSNSRWHPECFTCSVCGKVLANLLYLKKDKKIFCIDHYEEYKVCKACQKPIISNDCISTEQNYWHLEHFVCFNCKKTLADRKYLLANSNSYCLECYQNKFSKICETCNSEIIPTEERFTYEKLNWHSNSSCFKCFACHKDLTIIPFLIKKNRLFCSIICKKNHYKN